MQTPLYEKTQLREVTGATLRPGGLGLTRKGIELCGFQPGARLLDVGCGPGESLGLLRRFGFCALGLDKSPALLAEAARHGPALLADAAALPLRSGVLDGLLAECVLSILPDKDAALREMRRVLRPGGRIILSDLILRQGAGGQDSAGGASCIAGAETPERLLERLRAADFKILHCLDESRSLAELAARMIFKYGSPAAFFASWGLDGAACAAGGKNLGYALLVAEAKNHAPASMR